MATRQSVENLIEKANQCLAEANAQLNVTNRNGYDVDNGYTEAQQRLANVYDDIEKLMDSANHQQRDQLHRLHLRVSDSLNDMILDHVDTTQFSDR
ncbi:DUF2524 family protein [Radiobacillus sp. PE A8.2]|uniref:DUF2524 family protein n=1 Tax=Radiobacillus sp. PE A8.2 TaxID=3380349 RepID=UPI00388ED08A